MTRSYLILSHLIRHDSGHGPADLMVLMGFSFWSKQNKQEPGQEKQNEREKKVSLLQEHPRKALGAPSPERGSRRDTLGSATPR